MTPNFVATRYLDRWVTSTFYKQRGVTSLSSNFVIDEIFGRIVGINISLWRDFVIL